MSPAPTTFPLTPRPPLLAGWLLLAILPRLAAQSDPSAPPASPDERIARLEQKMEGMDRKLQRILDLLENPASPGAPPPPALAKDAAQASAQMPALVSDLDALTQPPPGAPPAARPRPRRPAPPPLPGVPEAADANADLLLLPDSPPAPAIAAAPPPGPPGANSLSLPLGPPPAADPAEAQLLPELKGIVLYPRGIAAGDFKEENVQLLPGVTFAGNLAPPDKAELKTLLAVRYLGKPVTFADLDRLTRELILHYRRRERPIVDIFIPQQDITDGIVKIAVVEGRVGLLSVSNLDSKWYSDAEILDRTLLRIGDPIDAAVVRDSLTILNTDPWDISGDQPHPFRSVDVVYKPGPREGETEVVLNVNDQRPFKFYTGYENTGNETLGENRLLAGAVWYNALGRDDQASFQLTSGSDTKDFWGAAANYRALLWRQNKRSDDWRARRLSSPDKLDLSASYSRTELAQVSAGQSFTTQAYSFQAGIRYSFALPEVIKFPFMIPVIKAPKFELPKLPTLDLNKIAEDPASLEKLKVEPPLIDLPQITRAKIELRLRHEAYFGFDYKRSNNNLAFGGTDIYASDTTIAQFILGYRLAESDSLGKSTLDLSLALSPGDLTDGNDDLSFAQARPGAESSYAYARLLVDRTGDLPKGAQLHGRLVAQLASTNLLPSEQLGFGGFNTIRGYPEQSILGDSGYIVSAELISPPIFTPAFRALTFADMGKAWVANPLDGDSGDPVTLSSAGVGLRLRLSRWVDLRLDYGWQLEALPGSDDKGSRAHIGLMMIY